MKLILKIFVGVALGILAASALLNSRELLAGYRDGRDRAIIRHLTERKLVENCGQPARRELRDNTLREYYVGKANQVSVLTWRGAELVNAQATLPLGTPRDPAIDAIVNDFEANGRYTPSELIFWLPCVGK